MRSRDQHGDGPRPRRGGRVEERPDELADLGVALSPLRIDSSVIRGRLEAIDAAGADVSGRSAEAGERVQQVVEHLAAEELIDLRPGDVVVDGADGQVRQMADGSADKILLERALGAPTTSLQVARVLRPGGAAAAFLPLSAAPTFRLRVVEPAEAAGLDVSVYYLVAAAPISERASTHFGVVLRKPAEATSVIGRPPTSTFAAPKRAFDLRAGRLETLLAPAVVLLSAVSVAVVTYGDLKTPLRPAIALIFLLACPGLALVHALRLPDRLAELTLAAALSIGCNTLVAGVLLFAGVSSSQIVLAVLLTLTLAAVLVDVMFGGRDRGVPGFPP